MQPIAFTEFAGGALRPVYEDSIGQYVVDDSGNRVDGVWYIPREECDTPIVIGDEFPADWGLIYAEQNNLHHPEYTLPQKTEVIVPYPVLVRAAVLTGQ